ncbi:hypothetical protein M8C21_019691 [Ambrosia artemisiifolia]|uniref:Isopenicillin N synthase-like Fe(2+) 2OG dioxygenase domain-containing protein n=1 Tax=Ambrosia artemisiifolia TaxID=4212 RepID=A0AAD5G8Y6_AMBAR|nr:hypothetical protein M8C21_019691 [Ambrosia artemisiifolia]
MQGKDAPTGIIPHKKGYVYTRNGFAKNGTHNLWRENLKHPCHPLEKCIHLWPDTPTRYQKAITTYLVEIQKLSSRILEMIGEGLGLEKGYFKDTSEVQLLSSNFYPPCADPSLTLGISSHLDPSLITLVYQGGSSGLQFIKDGEWINVGASPNAFVVNIVEPAKVLVNEREPSLYAASQYKDYVQINGGYGAHTAAILNAMRQDS